MPGSNNQKTIRACTIKILTLTSFYGTSLASNCVEIVIDSLRKGDTKKSATFHSLSSYYLSFFIQYSRFMVQKRITLFGSFLYLFPNKYPIYLKPLCPTSLGISQICPVFTRYARLFFTRRSPSPSDGTPSKISGCSA